MEDYKSGKARLLSIIEDSEDPVVKTVQPTIKTGRKWKVVEAVDEAKECLKIKEIIGQTQIDCNVVVKIRRERGKRYSLQ